MTAECVSGNVRLVSETSSDKGRLEVCKLGIWGTVCSDGFSNIEATVACQWLGFGKHPWIILHVSHLQVGSIDSSKCWIHMEEAGELGGRCL